jgi:uncharacterized repeat protein (TIGR03803 family)
MEDRMNSTSKNTAIASQGGIAESATNAICESLAIVVVFAMFFLATLSAQAQTESLLYTFTQTTTGFHPVSGLVRDTQGNLYGTTYQGGNTNCGGLGCGTVFELTPNGTLTVLYTFGGQADGATPGSGLILDKVGNLYGTTEYGGASGDGTVFEITTALKYKVIHSFTGSDGAVPYGGLLRDGQGNLYGTTEYGGANYGTVFKITPSGVETVLYSFTGGVDGGAPIGNLVMWKGNLYGTTPDGGVFGEGTVFEVTKKGKEKVLYSFTGGNDGASPFGGLIVDKEGNLYGTTVGGGSSGFEGAGGGTLFEVSQSGTESVLYNFSGGADGGKPLGSLVKDANGNFYGTTQTGGSDYNGVVFEVSPAGVETVLHRFTRGSDDGAFPESGVVRAGKALYGTTFYGGPNDGGTVFKVIP